MSDRFARVTITAAHHRKTLEARRIAEALLATEQEWSEHTREWAREAFREQVRLGARCEYLYGLAARLGATEDELRGPVAVRVSDPKARERV